MTALGPNGQGVRKLTYYANWRAREVNSSTLLRDRDGQCYSWAGYFEDIMRIQGFNYSYLTITAQDPKQYNLMVNTWKIVNKAQPLVNIVNPVGWDPRNQNGIPINGAGNGYNFLQANVVRDGTDAASAGQNNPNPASLFNNHILIKVGTELWDPSYGRIYKPDVANGNDALLGFQRQALFGLYKVQLVGNQLQMTVQPIDPTGALVIRGVEQNFK